MIRSRWLLRGSMALERVAVKLVRRQVVLALLAVFLVTNFVNLELMMWIDKASFIALVLFFLVWSLDRWQRRLRTGYTETF